MDTSELKFGTPIQVWDVLTEGEHPEWVSAMVIDQKRRPSSDGAGFRATATTTSNGLPIEYDLSHRGLHTTGEPEIGAVRLSEPI